MADNPLHEKLESANPFYPAKNNMNPLDIDKVVQLIQQYAVNVVWEQAYHCPCLDEQTGQPQPCLLYTSPSPRDRQKSRMPSSA